MYFAKLFFLDPCRAVVTGPILTNVAGAGDLGRGDSSEPMAWRCRIQGVHGLFYANL